jgi:hypothetical protein
LAVRPHYEVLRVFIASPSDVARERADAEQIIKALNESCRDLGLIINCVNWEAIAPQTPRHASIQEEINDRVRTCDIFVLMLWKTAGSTERGYTRPNTERELGVALDRLQNGERIRILSYFRRLANNSDPGVQERAVRKMKERLKRLWFAEYDKPADFKDRFVHDLLSTILGLHAHADKQRALRSFWSLGVAQDQVVPRVNILYPPVDRAFMHRETPDNIWLHRLAPHVVFENYKAIQKIDKTLRLVGVNDIHDYGIASIPSTLHASNRIWICLPRNLAAHQHFRRYEDLLRFRFVPRRDEEHRSLVWHRLPNQSVHVRSPLNRYLRAQRRGAMKGGLISNQHLRIVAKDYAVLGRFSDTSEQSIGGEPLKDFCFSGLRGLGTWGAGWFLDRRFGSLPTEPNWRNTIQILLEVTYVNGRVVDAKDVSAEPASYFKEANDEREIARIVQRLHP